MLLFETAPGVVVQLPVGDVNQGVLPAIAGIGGADALTFQEHKVIITGVTMTQEVSRQINHSLGTAIWIYVFGNRMGNAIIQGLAVASVCGEGGGVSNSNSIIDRALDPRLARAGVSGGGTASRTEHGAAKVLRWYQANRLSSRRAPVQLMIGEATVNGFVVGTQINASDADTRLVSFSIAMDILPTFRFGR